MPDPEWFKRRPMAPVRTRKAGEEVWGLNSPDGRLQWCELRYDSVAGAGWDVMMLDYGEPLFSRRCVDEREARYVAKVFKQDTQRGGGWREQG
jgi:hypothetical protein